MVAAPTRLGFEATPGYCLVAGKTGDQNGTQGSGKSETVVATSLQRPVSATSSWIKLLQLLCGLCCELTVHRSEASEGKWTVLDFGRSYFML